MPNPKSGTVTDDIASAIAEVKAGRVEFKMDKTSNMSVIIGKRSFSEDKLAENAKVVLDSVVAARPEAVKGKFINSIAISATMSPSVKVALSEVEQ
jgi:large subunit ribosomal protein L1